MSETNEQDKYNEKILQDIAEYIKSAPGLRFGQILFNLNIIEFADKNNPEVKEFLLRDIHTDSSSTIHHRVRKVIKQEKEEN